MHDRVFRASAEPSSGNLVSGRCWKPRIDAARFRVVAANGDPKGEEFGLGQDKEKTTPAAGPSADVGDDREVGSALRSVYQQTVSEKVPDDLLDLLGKLT